MMDVEIEQIGIESTNIGSLDQKKGKNWIQLCPEPLDMIVHSFQLNM